MLHQKALQRKLHTKKSAMSGTQKTKFVQLKNNISKSHDQLELETFNNRKKTRENLLNEIVLKVAIFIAKLYDFLLVSS